MIINFFEIFEIPETPNVNLEQLRKKYFEMQRLYHPDHSKGPGPDIVLINKGYETLSNRISVLLHILEIKDISINTITNDTSFLMQCMEWQEGLLQDTNRSIIIQDMNKAIANLMEEAATLAKENKFIDMSHIVEKIVYLDRLTTQSKLVDNHVYS